MCVQNTQSYGKRNTLELTRNILVLNIVFLFNFKIVFFTDFLDGN